VQGEWGKFSAALFILLQEGSLLNQ
jgi:hypothetical protein